MRPLFDLHGRSLQCRTIAVSQKVHLFRLINFSRQAGEGRSVYNSCIKGLKIEKEPVFIKN